jgi:hypothetical protein
MAIPERWRTVEGSDQKVAIGAASAQSAAVGPYTYAVLLSCSSNCHIVFGTNPTATATSWMLKSTDPGLILGIAPGEKLAVIQDSGAGSLFIVELTA